MNNRQELYLPTVIEDKGSKEYRFDIVSRLMRENIIFLGEEIDFHVANIICAQMIFLEAEDPSKDIILYINSPGGSVIDGLAIYDTIQYIQNDVSTVCLGQAASMAAVLLLAGAKKKRYCLKNSRIMIHQGGGGIRGQATDIEIYAKEIVRLENLINQIMSNHTGKDLKFIEESQKRDNYLVPTEALQFGIVDQII